ncbi:hypothetical protein EWE75_21780 [Sphingomonas populi]|uniref:Glycosyl-hydrolase 97 C-terminal oligomerisation domain-containing protein n=1 Tax=Sphingomonas populi TaxID=2484750 RepID=A0A4Q6XL65_9SPHN|nr:hypothetical protein EWE75_21780 [Sphingomonas populi]
MTDEAARIVALPLSFLGKGKWHIRAWLDGKRPPDLDRRTGTISYNTRLFIPLSANGGVTLILEP